MRVRKVSWAQNQHDKVGCLEDVARSMSRLRELGAFATAKRAASFHSAFES